jgi:hypothetical protein
MTEWCRMSIRYPPEDPSTISGMVHLFGNGAPEESVKSVIQAAQLGL